MKTLMISPYQYLDVNDFVRLKQPLGIALLKQNTSSEVEILDAMAEGYNNRYIKDGVLRVGLELSDIGKRIEKENPRVIGISNLWSANYPAVLEISKYVKDNFPEITTIIGGVHPSFEYSSILREPAIDYIAIREATTSFPEFIDFLENKRTWQDVHGIARRINTSIDKRPNPKSNDLQYINPIDYTLFPVELYAQQKKFGKQFENVKNADIVTSLGCPHSCDYCSTKRMYPGKFRKYSSEQLDYMLDSILEAGYDFVSVQDDNLAANPNHAKSLIKKLNKRNLPWHWEGGVEIEFMPYILEEICGSTCQMVDMAIESSNKANKIYDKFTPKTEKILRKELKQLQISGIFVNSSFMLGLPGESKKETYETISYAKQLKEDGLINHANFHLATAYPGTKFAELDYEKPNGTNPSDYFGYSVVVGNIPHLELTRAELIELRNEADKYVNGEELYEQKRMERNRY